MIQVMQYLPTGNGLVQRTVIQIPETGNIREKLIEILARAHAACGRILTPAEDAERERGWQDAVKMRCAADGSTPPVFPTGDASALPVTPAQPSALEPPLQPFSAPPKPDIFAPTVGVRETSMMAYEKIKWDGTMTAQQKVVMDWLRPRIGDATRSEIEKGTGLKINAVTGRVHELITLGALVESPKKRKCRVTGETVNAVAVAS